MIGDDIEVVVIDVRGDQVKLGIRAPRNVSVHRTEIYKDIQDQNQKAASSSVPTLSQLNDLFKKKRTDKKDGEK